MSSNGNGNGLTRWLLGAVFTVAMLFAGWISTATTSRVQAVEDDAKRQGQEIAVLKEQVQTLRLQLSRIEDKLDRALAR